MTRRTLAIVSLLLLTLSACGAQGKGAIETDAASRLQGEFSTIGGGNVELDALAGQDLVLWFWAPW